ncbi:MAG: TRAP transporter fused permease subunit [Clostridia bacterium]|nr:TRAP transporter fused permease subunit [Clostridia bacterium]
MESKKTDITQILKYILYVIALLGGLLHIYNSAFGTISSFQMRPLHLAIVGVIAVLMELTKLKDKKHPVVTSVMNIVIMLFVLFGVSELLFNYNAIARTAGNITPKIVVCCTLLVIAILFFTERKVGKALPIIAFIFILYALFGQYLPGIMGHRGYTYKRVMYFLYVNGNGIFGTALDTSARYLVLFMIMGQFIEISGTSKLFMALADYVSSKLRGGAAKSSVVASALFGTISGTPIANVMVTGAFTIPMMKKSGFEADFAAGVEATASTGGLIMPPMMGAGAFVMAELLGLSYSSIMVAAIIPALLYYFSIYLAIDFYSAKSGIGRVEEIDIAEVKQRIKTYAHTILPLAAFIVSVILGYSVFRSAIICIILTPIIAALRKETRMSIKDVLDGIAKGMMSTVSLGAACACAGIIVGVISLTGFGFSFAALLGVFKNIPILALMITMLVCIIMGMGMPAVASYMITATIAANTLVNMGFSNIAVHMFVFFFSCFSSVTPPVALASYSAAGLAQTNPMKTGYRAFLLALVAFIVP